MFGCETDAKLDKGMFELPERIDNKEPKPDSTPSIRVPKLVTFVVNLALAVS